MQSRRQTFLNDESGATAIEYGLIVSLMIVVLLVGLTALGGSNDGMWGNVAAKVGGALQ